MRGACRCGRLFGAIDCTSELVQVGGRPISCRQTVSHGRPPACQYNRSRGPTANGFGSAIANLHRTGEFSALSRVWPRSVRDGIRHHIHYMIVSSYVEEYFERIAQLLRDASLVWWVGSSRVRPTPQREKGGGRGLQTVSLRKCTFCFP